MPEKNIHIGAWNLNHRTGRKTIPPAVIHAIATLDIDILVLTEFVDGDHHAKFKDSLKDIGYESVAVSVKAPRQNQVLIAARSAMADEDLLPVPGYTEAASTNWLHRRFPSLKLEIVGLRAPVYLAAGERTGYWSQVESIVQSAKARPILFVGDFNCDPHTDTRPCAAVFPRLRHEGFHLPSPAGEWSYRSADGVATTRVDHALASPGLRLADARYLYRAGRTVLAGQANGHGEPLSDHALLSIKVVHPAAQAATPRTAAA